MNDTALRLSRPSPPKRRSVRWPAVLFVAAAVGLLFYLVPSRIVLLNDVAASLPAHDPVVADTLYIIGQQAFLNSVFLDLSLAGEADEPSALVAAAERLKARLTVSGLFRSIGTEGTGENFPALLSSITGCLPSLFDEQELRDRVAGSLRPEKIRDALRENATLLRKLEGIGQAELISRDPLGWRNMILAKLGLLLPSAGAQIHKGYVFSPDRRHLLLPAQPVSPGTDVVFARRLASVLDEATLSLTQDPEFKAKGLRILSFGAFRATLDNENYSRSGARKAAWISLIGISLLLLVSFRRPLLGLLCLVPALAGTALSLFTMSLVQRSISILALGFGGALIGIAVDQGIAYLIFLDREQETTGWEASRSVWVVSLAATLTTVVSFFALRYSGFPMLRQLGLFAGLGVFFAFLFVHLVFPMIFSTMPASRRRRLIPIDILTSPRFLRDGRLAAGASLLLFAGLAWFAKPEFQGNLSALNTVSPETAQAEKQIERIWGDVLNNVYLMVEGATPEELWRHSDELTLFLQGQAAGGKITAAFTPSLILPGPEIAVRHQAAWRSFWTPERIASFRTDLDRIQVEFGFRTNAFAPFIRMLEQPGSMTPVPTENLFSLLGISPSPDQNRWMSLGPVVAGPKFDRESFYRGAKEISGVRVLDNALFADHLARLLFKGFAKMLVICVVGLALVLVLFFGELTLPSIVLGHTVFALVCTLGTLKILGRPLNIPELAVAIIVPGMGSDFALFFTRSYQRYLDERQSAMAVFRNAVFLSAAATMIGFAGLAVSDHHLLQSIGWAGFLAIGYSALGAFLLLPPVLRRVLAVRPWPAAADGSSPSAVRSVVLRRYRHLEISLRLFARFKMLCDPMFPRLKGFLPPSGTVLDIGCGYGVSGAWLLAQFPGLKVHGLDPDPKRVRVARHVFGSRGTAAAGRAPDLPPEPARVEGALMMDTAHFLSDADLHATLKSLAAKLLPGGRLMMRTALPLTKNASRMRRIEEAAMGSRKRAVCYRSPDELRKIFSEAGFLVELIEPSTRRAEVICVLGRSRGSGEPWIPRDENAESARIAARDPSRKNRPLDQGS